MDNRAKPARGVALGFIEQFIRVRDSSDYLLPPFLRTL